MDTSLADILEMHVAPKEEFKPPAVVEEPKPIVPDKTVQDDFDATRKTLQQIIQKGLVALNHATEVAMSTEEPRAFEVVSKMIKDISDANAQLMETQLKMQKLKEPAKSTNGANANLPVQHTTTNNVIFTGSTSDLNRIFNERLKGQQHGITS